MPDTHKLILPEVGEDWLDGLVDRYIILSLKHSTPESSMFWKGNRLGYTCSLLNAGLYWKEEIMNEPTYYNDGLNALAIPCTQAALETLGIFTVTADYSMIRIFLNKRVAETQE